MSESKDTVNSLQQTERIVDQQGAARNSRRRARYAQMSPERKQLFLTQLREKRAELKKRKLFHDSSTTVSSQEFDRRAPKRRHTQRNVDQQNAAKNSRRRARYAQMPPERKQLFLIQLRENRAELKKRKLLHDSSTIVSSQEFGRQAPKRRHTQKNVNQQYAEQGRSGLKHKSTHDYCRTVILF